MFQLTSPTEVTLKTFTPRTERHGDDEVSAASLGLKFTGPNTLLDILQPGLRDMLYKAVEGQDQLPGVDPHTPLLRAKGVESVKLGACFEGWTLKIDRGMDESDPFVIGGARVDKFVVTPHEGGSVELDFRIGSSDIDETEAGWLYGHQKQDITITLWAPEKKADVIDGSTEAFERDHPTQVDLIEDAGDVFSAAHGGPDEDEDGEGDAPDSRGDGWLAIAPDLEARLDGELAATDAEPKPARGRRSRKAAEVE